jgi:Cdc6-like AAA superfamily ATPase
MRVDWRSLLKHYTRPKKGLFPVGSRVYIGRQGEGKTLSMVNYAYRIKEAYPNSAKFFDTCHIDYNIHHYA